MTDWHEDDYDPETGEILASQALGVDENGPQFTRLHPDLVQDAYLKLGFSLAELNAQANFLDDMRKPVRARKFRAFRKGGLGVSDADTAAESSAEYVEHLKAIKAARTLADFAKVRLEAFRMAWETARTVAATERHAVKM